jgi:TonB-dependent SusC/RagA subfamily outer membrane receptor
MFFTHSATASRVFVPAVLVALAACGTAATMDAGSGPEPQRPRMNVVTAEQIRGMPTVSSVEEIIVRLVPGVRYGRRADGSLGLNVMGFAMGRGQIGGDPLIVIDGVPASRRMGSIGLNPRDIARIEVLKDGASLAGYGVRGADGVIIIQTKVRH